MRKFITTILLIVIHSTFLIGQSSFVEMKEAAMIAQNFMNNKQQTSKTVANIVTERFEGKNSVLNAMQMANVSYETGLFHTAEPDLMINNLINCSNDQYFNHQWGVKNL